MSRQPTEAELQKINVKESEEMYKAAAEDEQIKQIRAFRKKYVGYKVYIYPCNGCKRYGMLLHQETCVICGTQNQFYDSSIKVSESINNKVLEDVMKIAEVLGFIQLPEP